MMQTSKPISASNVPSSSGAWQVEEEEAKKEASAVAASPSASPSNALRMRLSDWLLLIPDYDGRAHALGRFTASVRYVASQLGPGAERVLLLALGFKLHGRALDYFQHGLHKYASVEEFLASLHARFAGVGREIMLLDEMRQAQQHGDESLARFAFRIDRLATQLCSIYAEDRNSEIEAREANKRIVKESALASFRRGLKSAEMELRLGACEPKSFEEAIDVAVALDNEMRCRESLPSKMKEESRYYVHGKKRRYE